ncbi:MAG TPA: AraC family transcriptional regulator [Ruminiclostridium sp.]
MQKQLSERNTIKFIDVPLNDHFPVKYFAHTQKHTDLIRLHYHNSFEIGLCLEGCGTFFIENKALSFNIGDVSFIYPSQPHIAQSPNGLPSKWLFIDVDLGTLFADNKLLIKKLWEDKQQIPYIMHSDHHLNLVSISQMIVEELEQQEQNYELVVKELFSTFIYKLSRLCNNSRDNLPTLSDAFWSISPALTYISQNYSNEVTSNDLAKICNLSETHFRVLFKKAIGKPPLQYLAYIRMKMAKALLKSTEFSVLCIAQSVGYDSISSFNRTFKAQFSQSPSTYKKMSL